MYEKCSSELERPYLPSDDKEGAYKSKDENCNLGRRESEGVIVLLKTLDNKTMLREGPLLHSSF